MSCIVYCLSVSSSATQFVKLWVIAYVLVVYLDSCHVVGTMAGVRAAATPLCRLVGSATSAASHGVTPPLFTSQ